MTEKMKPQVQTKEIRTPSIIPYYLTGAVWVLLSLFLPMYQLSGLLTCAVVAILSFIGGRLYFKDTVETVEIVEEESYLDAGIRAMMEEGRQMLDSLTFANDQIENEIVSYQIEEIANISAEIFQYVKNKPEKVRSIRKFMNYYLPTTLKLLNQYSMLEKQSIKTSNITTSLDKIEGMVKLIVEAFKKQLNHLFESETIDISVDITVMENMMAQEGLIAGQGMSKVKE